jgi:aminoglycoside phosphotransferase (APT) family kinase protein
MTRVTWFQPAGSTGQELRAGLLGLERLSLVSDPLRKLAERAVERLDAGAWHPRRVLTHGDFWLGNVLEGRHALTEPGHQPWERFSVIDWAGSRTDGLPIYDLIRLSMSVRLSPRALRSEVESHCRALACPVSDAPFYLAASLGEIGQNLNHFPVQNYVRMADSCLRELERIGL